MGNRTLSRQSSREVDRRAVEEYGMTGLVLMENAGRGVADVLCRRLPSPAGTIAICCGKGNNGGDGFVVARHLDLRGHEVRVLIWAEPDELTGDAAANFQIIRKADIAIDVLGEHHDARRLEHYLHSAAWIVDALLGTGSWGEPRPPLDTVIDQINSAAAPKLAIDLPSGLDCDTGAAAVHTIRATETCTFVAMKQGFLVPAAAAYLGQVHVLGIGVPRKLVEEIVG